MIALELAGVGDLPEPLLGHDGLARRARWVHGLEDLFGHLAGERAVESRGRAARPAPRADTGQAATSRPDAFR